jgi:hypothetical protein
MPEFVNPFSGIVPRKMTHSELVRAIRLNLSAEEEATHLYTAHADATDNELAKKVLFQRLLNILLDDEEELLAEGAQEVNEMAGQNGNNNNNPKAISNIPTVGNLKPHK